MKDKQFQDLVGKYLVINGQEPGFKIKKITKGLDRYTSIIFCEHNLNLYVSDSNIQFMYDGDYCILINSNSFSIENAPKNEVDIKTNNTKEHSILKNILIKLKKMIKL